MLRTWDFRPPPRLGAIVEGSSDTLQRTLRRRSALPAPLPYLGVFSRATEVPRPLQAGEHTHDMHHDNQHSELDGPSAPDPRAHPPTPPTSPADCNGGDSNGVAVAKEQRFQSNDEWGFAEDFDGFVGLDGIPA